MAEETESMQLVVKTSITPHGQKGGKTKGFVLWPYQAKFQPALRIYVKDRYEAGAVSDILAIPGGGLGFLHDEDQQKRTFRSMGKSLKRGSQKVEVAIPAIRGESFGEIKATLLAIKSIIRSRFPEVIVVLLALRPDGAWIYEWEKDVDQQDQD